MATEHTVGFEPADRLAKDRESVRRRFWIKLKRVVAKLPFAEDLLAAYYCAFDKQTPRHVQAALLGAIAYFILPFDFIPDMLPVLGFTDDAAVLATAIRLVATHITPEHRDAARAALKRGIGSGRNSHVSQFARVDSAAVASSRTRLRRSMPATAMLCRARRRTCALAFCSASQAWNCLNSASLSASAGQLCRRRILLQEFVEPVARDRLDAVLIEPLLGGRKALPVRQAAPTAKLPSISDGRADSGTREIS